MDDDTPHLETLPIKVEYDCELVHRIPIKLEEGEIDEGDSNVRPQLVAYSSSPAPLIEDCLALSESNDDATQLSDTSDLHDQLELSTYEYDALGERYRKLFDQHDKLKQLTAAYHDIVHGSSTHEKPGVGLEKLHAEAGCEGLRAKALEADVLRPVIHHAGGLEAVIFLTQSIKALIEQAGSLENIQRIVQGTTALSRRVQELGGLQGLNQLVADSESLVVETQALAELRHMVDGPNGLRSKATKYDRLQQAFTVVEARCDEATPRTNVSATISSWEKKKFCGPEKDQADSPDPIKTLPLTLVQKLYPTLPRPTDIPSTELGVMNPARAQLLISQPEYGDPDRDLYEPKEKPPVRNMSTKANNANNMPLGRSRTNRSSEDYHLDTSRKRKHKPDAQIVITKRPRVDVGRASALVQATLAVSRTDSANVVRPYTQPELSRSSASHSNICNETDRIDRSSAESLLGPVHHGQRPTVKTEAATDDVWDACSSIAPATGPSKEFKARVLIDGYPIALWVGASHPNSYNSTDLIKDDKVPYKLAMFLFSEMKKHMKNANAKVWAAMAPNSDTCILRYLLDGHRPSGLPQESRACRMCSSAWVRHHRPCALLLEIRGVRSVVFMPLRDALRRGVAWTEKGYWIMDI